MSGPLTLHGGRLTDACLRFGGEAGDWLDLSTGVNPQPWQRGAPLEIDWRALPDPAALADLEETAALAFGANPDFCAAVPGSEAGLRAVAQLLQLPGQSAPLTYSTHAQAFAGIPEGNGSALVIANPNNPDGTVLSRTMLLEKLADQERAGGWLLVDEAFVDCRPGWSVADLVADHRRLIVTRSFGKFFGLAGVRLGFVLAPHALLQRLRHLMGEWPICAAGLAFGPAAYGDQAWIGQTRAWLPQAAARLDGVLRRYGLAPSGHCPLFRLTRTSAAARLFDGLARRHILTRPFSAHPDLLRFGLPGDDHALLRLERALAEICLDG